MFTVVTRLAKLSMTPTSIIVFKLSSKDATFSISRQTAAKTSKSVCFNKSTKSQSASYIPLRLFTFAYNKTNGNQKITIGSVSGNNI